MNVSIQDAFNLGWKLAAVLTGRASTDLLHTYSAERQAVAKQLIDFDREWAQIISSPPRNEANPDGYDPAEVQAYFTAQGRYTAGLAVTYSPSLITAQPDYQPLAEGFGIGQRFHSAPVVRLADARALELGHTARADGRWRIYAFADTTDPRRPDSALGALCSYLTDNPASPLQRVTPAGADIDDVIDIRGIVRQSHRDLSVLDLPALLRPHKGQLGLRDYEKAFCPADETNIFDVRGIDPAGCMIIVRPDQYVAHILPLHAHEELAAFFTAFMIDTKRSVVLEC